MSQPLSGAEKRSLRSRAQRLEPVLRIGRAGASEAWLRSLDQELTLHELVKVRFAELKEERKTLAPEIAVKSGSELIALVGNVAVFYRAKPADAAIPARSPVT